MDEKLTTSTIDSEKYKECPRCGKVFERQGLNLCPECDLKEKERTMGD